ncbi:YnfA family protein [Leptospira idonii]|uniref:YnfA family protein n=1 Tax=Leptospira idonii TaxID=1193500 RepID=A0A4R9LZP7_9LEPT|nr:YnfA family protein [Leptospira idonii]TGN19242.1 YnfA family protein [Leptospira idonii]
MLYLKVAAIFLLAGICEIGGGYLVWLWLRQEKPFWYACIGFAVLGLYGVVATLQPADFTRTYAAYGGVFIFLSLLWGWKFENSIPDRYDLIGSVIVLIGVGILYFAPRGS